MNVHVCRSRAVVKLIRRGRCADCGRMSRFTVIGWEWYGPSVTCLRCGRSWEDGMWVPLPFEPRSREKEVARAKRRYLETEVVEP